MNAYYLWLSLNLLAWQTGLKTNYCNQDTKTIQRMPERWLYYYQSAEVKLSTFNQLQRIIVEIDFLEDHYLLE